MKKLIFIISAAVCLFACNVQKKQIADMEVYAVRYPDQFKILANTLVPCFTGAPKESIIIKHDTTNKTDTLLSKIIGDDTVFLTKTITKNKTIRDTVLKTDTVTDNRSIAALQATLSNIQGDLLTSKDNESKATKDAKDANSASIKWMLLFIGACIVILGYVAWKVYLFFAGGAEVGAIKKII